MQLFRVLNSFVPTGFRAALDWLEVSTVQPGLVAAIAEDIDDAGT